MKNITSIQISKDLRDKLKIMVAKMKLRNYNELIELIIKENDKKI
jgi:hypothetical protein